MDLSVLMYHSVGSGHRRRMTVSEAALAGHLTGLQSMGYRFVSLTEMLGLIGGEGGLPTEEPLVHVGFDDGYRSTVTRAKPILETLGVSASVAVCSSYLSGNFDPGNLPHEETEMMTWVELEEWISSGFEVVSHGVSHRDLTELDDQGVRAEVAGDFAAIADRVGPPIAFAFPFGRRTPAVVEIVAEYFAFSFAADSPRRAQIGQRHEIPRVQVEESFRGWGSE
jgi:peptidoglycan/xylan/chitin deacetylase (PgdA/CDA1 family)